MSIEIEAYVGRTTDYTGEISGIDGVAVPEALDAADLLKLRITNYRRDLILELESGTPSAEDSVLTISDLGDGSVQKPEYTLRLAEGDMTFPAGLYRVELIWIDSTETAPADASKRIDIGTLDVLPSAPAPVVVP